MLLHYRSGATLFGARPSCSVHEGVTSYGLPGAELGPDRVEVGGDGVNGVCAEGKPERSLLGIERGEYGVRGLGGVPGLLSVSGAHHLARQPNRSGVGVARVGVQLLVSLRVRADVSVARTG